MEDGDGEDLTPFWVQNTTNLRRGERLRRGVASLFFSSGLVIFLLLVTAVFFLVFIVPKTLSFSANIFRPNSVKKSWDSLNVLLVLVAVMFGFLSRNMNEEREKEKEREVGSSSYYDEFRESSIKEIESLKSNLSAAIPANQWYGYSDYAKLEHSNLSVRRNSSSYPDLREVSPTNWGYGDYQRRYYDDIYVDSGRSSDPVQIHNHRRHRSLEQVDYLREPPRAKTIFVDTLVRKSTEAINPPLLPTPPPMAAPLAPTPEEYEEITNESAAMGRERSWGKMDMDLESLFEPISAAEPPLPPAAEESQLPDFEENQRRAYERVTRKRERSSRRRNKNVESAAPITTPPSPPLPPPERKSSKSEKKRGGATGSSAKVFLNSLYGKKKKQQRQKSVDNLDSLLHEAQPTLSFQIPPPPPPPPPPPSAFQNLFLSKKQKRNRTITVRLEPYPTAPPPPLPPPRAAARGTERTFETTRRPPKPIKMNSFDKLDETSNSGGESPFNRIPAPPPPPPPAFFSCPAWKFVVQGDYVRVNSTTSSRSGSPDPDETESDVTPSAAYGGETVAFQPSPMFCPSPDVDTKAESFITNFRAKLKLEKNNSMRKREPGLSSLGPRPGPGPRTI
ncbi:hypothetical protein ACS0TY_036218 [Phlomoides rotata]